MSLVSQCMIIQTLGLFTIPAVAPANAATIYVNDNASGNNDGSSWSDAFTELQSALAIATSGDEIWVAVGTYLPDYDVNSGTHTGDRTASFNLITGVAIYGGLAGDENPATFNLDNRDYKLHETILSGDLNNDDNLISMEEFVACFDGAQGAFNVGNAVFNLGINSRIEKQVVVAIIEAYHYGDNSYHVVTAIGVNTSAILDGFTTTHGVGDPYSYGAGILGKLGASPTIRNSKITENMTYEGYGAGVYDCDGPITDCQITCNHVFTSPFGGGGGLYKCDGPITDCYIAGNTGGGEGGGLADCNGEITQCTIVDNGLDSDGDGGGLYNCDGSITDCTIAGNYGGDCGGLYGCDGIIKNCNISGNQATYLGGGVRNCNGIIANCLITANYCEMSGGGMVQCDGTIINCFITNNWTSYYEGGGLLSCNGLIANCTIAGNEAGRRWDHYGGGLSSCTGSIVNCIVWGNIAKVDAQLSNCSTPTYSCIQDWTGGGEGNIDGDPLFMNADGPDDIPGNEDDDLHLQPGSPCIDTGDNDVVPEDVATDLDGNPRIADGNSNGMAFVDMGTYELQPIKTNLDILPSDDPNMFVPNKQSKGKARIPMAIIATEDVAAEDINPESILIAGVLSPIKTSTDNDINGDGLVDLVMHFSRRGLIDALSLDTYEVGDVVEVTVTAARIGDDWPIEATDSIVIVGSKN